jgi:Lamin Tail Domain
MRTTTALAALTLFLLFSSARAVYADDVFTSAYTNGCFNCDVSFVPNSPATQTVTLGGLTYTNSKFSGTTANGFLAIGDGPSPPGVQGTNNIGSLTLSASPISYDGNTLTLRVTFTAPQGIAGGGSSLYTAMLTGTVTDAEQGGVFVDFDNTPQLFTFNDKNCQATTVPNQQTTCGTGWFYLTVNDLALDPGQTFSITGQITGAQQVTPPPPGLIISEFRFSGANTQDEFVELYNNTDAPVTVATTDGSAGWALVSNDSGTVTVRARINNGTVIPARAHYLFASSPFIGGYQLTGYAVPDNAMIPPDISNGGGVAIFRTANAASFTLANRLDAVGFSGVSDPLYKEGAGLSPSGGIAPTTSNYSFVRDLSGGTPKDTDDNAADFRLVSNDGAVLGGVQSTLGAPGPESLASPADRTALFGVSLFDTTQSASAPPNRERDFTPDPANNSPQGTLTIRRRITNNTGASVTRLRFRVAIITGFPSQGSGVADLRVRTSSDATVNAQTVLGTVVESPSVSNNGGLNTSLALPSVTTAPVSSGGDGDEISGPGGLPVYDDTVGLDAPLSNGASVNVQFLLGVVQSGRFRFYVNIEALP